MLFHWSFLIGLWFLLFCMLSESDGDTDTLYEWQWHRYLISSCFNVTEHLPYFIFIFYVCVCVTQPSPIFVLLEVKPRQACVSFMVCVFVFTSCLHAPPVLIRNIEYTKLTSIALEFLFSLLIMMCFTCADLVLWQVLCGFTWLIFLWSLVEPCDLFSLSPFFFSSFFSQLLLRLNVVWVACCCSLGFLNGAPVTEVHLKETQAEPQPQEGGCACWVLCCRLIVVLPESLERLSLGVNVAEWTFAAAMTVSVTAWISETATSDVVLWFFFVGFFSFFFLLLEMWKDVEEKRFSTRSCRACIHDSTSTRLCRNCTHDLMSKVHCHAKCIAHHLKSKVPFMYTWQEGPVAVAFYICNLKRNNERWMVNSIA